MFSHTENLHGRVRINVDATEWILGGIIVDWSFLSSIYPEHAVSYAFFLHINFHNELFVTLVLSSVVFMPTRLQG